MKQSIRESEAAACLQTLRFKGIYVVKQNKTILNISESDFLHLSPLNVIMWQEIAAAKTSSAWQIVRALRRSKARLEQTLRSKYNHNFIYIIRLVTTGHITRLSHFVNRL